MNSPNFLPKDKFDLDACAHLSRMSNAHLTPHLPELVSWLADGNWPVSRPITERLSSVGFELAPHLLEVLQSQDDTAKYFLLSGLMLECRHDVRALCMDEIIRIVNMPTQGEIIEEVTLVAGDVMALYKRGNNQ